MAHAMPGRREITPYFSWGVDVPADVLWGPDSEAAGDLADRGREFMPADAGTNQVEDGRLPLRKRGHGSTSNRFA